MQNSDEEKKEVIKDSNYYYGIKVSSYRNLLYEDVLYLKIIAAKKLMKKLVLEDNMQDFHRIFDVEKAIKGNKKQLNFELGYSMADISEKINKLQKEEENV
jgi:hypothetical protein